MRLMWLAERPYDLKLTVPINGITGYLWRAVDQQGNVLDVLVQSGETPKQPSASSVNYLRACSMYRACW